MRIAKIAVLGLALTAFGAASALACGYKGTAQSTKPETSQTTVSTDKK
jgi:hypothetical protein